MMSTDLSSAASFPIDLGPEAAAIATLPDIDAILEVCARVTGMGYAVVAHVTEDRWLACAVLDEVDFGLPVGGELPIRTTLCNEVRQTRAPIAFDQASADQIWREHHTPRTYGLESYIAVPIVLETGEFFGTLCAIDPKPAPASRPETVRMFQLFASLIATQLDAHRRVIRSEAALLDAQETAELRDQFIAVLGHDLRNPVAAIEAGAALLERRIGDEDARRILREMKGSTARIGRLINDVLDFARGRLGGGLPMARLPVEDLATQLHQVVDELRAAYPTRTVEADIRLSGVVAGDPDRIAQLMSNLLANALAHGDPFQPVRVSAALVEDEFELAVANGGRPIPESIRPRLFQPFNRRDTPEVREGLGLGLYIASQIAVAHGGGLTVASDDAETRFVFRMPANGEV
jgi:signal transduction histidine kinase